MTSNMTISQRITIQKHH